MCLEYREAFRQPDGWRVIEENLAEGLHQASARGTGDDATAAFLFFDEDETGTAGGGVAAVSVPDGEAYPHEVVGGSKNAGMSGSDSDLTVRESTPEVPGSSSPECGDGGEVAGHDRHGAESADSSEPSRDLGTQGGTS